ncbi:L,D-transpeptidase family protein [Henriciella aquimarina]|uniref:L,D-transpeptidase family protein n=1 Tax=Henriciella aquimarina TaxID=545261 RepID=UPI0009FDB5B3|nr:L,D-transpeptidase family protein [Henriciella aquimarina]
MTAAFHANGWGEFTGLGLAVRCAVGKSGLVPADKKQEGDGASPIGTWRMKRVFFRPDRLERPETALPTVPLRPQDGWCDAPTDPLYNRPVRLPYPASHEELWRDDHIYDVIVELDHNSDPVVPGLGSAVFFHLARPDYSDTQGCIAVAQDDMLKILAKAEPGTTLTIEP